MYSQIKEGVKARPPGDTYFPSGESSIPVCDARLGEEEKHQARLLFHKKWECKANEEAARQSLS